MKALKDCQVLVTPTSFGREEPELKEKLEEAVGQVTYNTTGKPLSSELLVELIPDVDGYIAGLDWIDQRALDAATRLKVIARYGAGLDRVDLDAARKRGVIVTNTPGANAVAVAELTIGLLLNLARPIIFASSQMRQGHWPRTKGISLQGKTIGIIGLGAIGKEVARRLAGFDCNVLAHDVVTEETFAARYGVMLTSLENLLSQADFVSLHIPVLPKTKHLVDAAFLDRMKQGAFLINTSRGELVDESALYEALVSEKLRGAAIDAFTHEPPDDKNPLLSLEQVIPTPHMGAHADSATNAMGRMALENCLAVLKGEPPVNQVI